MGLTKEIEKLVKKKQLHRYWCYRNKDHIKKYELKRYPKRKQYILDKNSKRKCKTGFKISHGYKYVCRPNHPYCSHEGFVAEHRDVMECYLGRYLEKHEVVHHKDENKLNNKIENLELFYNISEHSRFHMVKKWKEVIPKCL